MKIKYNKCISMRKSIITNELLDVYKKKEYYTDKNTRHCYISEVYNSLFFGKEDITKNILEIGIDQGGSILLWKHYFKNSRIYGIDIKYCKNIEGQERITQITGNAYSDLIVNTLPNNFDIMIDDGPHTLESVVFFLEKYIYKLNHNGILVIEDIQDISWFKVLDEHVSEILKSKIKHIDLRHVNNIYDDVLYIIDLSDTIK